MAQTVRHHKKRRTQHRIVACYLVEYPGGDFDRWSLVLDDAHRAQVSRENHGVAAATSAIERQSDLVSHHSGGIFKVVYEVMHEMLTHPFLGCENEPLAASGVIDADSSVGIATERNVKGWQIQTVVHFLGEIGVGLGNSA